MGKKVLTMEDMEQTNGGLIVDTKDGWFHVVDDHDGYVLNTSNVNKKFAMRAARMNGQSQEFISTAEYKNKFGKVFSPNK